MLNVVYEDNHLIVVNKACGDLVQGDRTGDRTLADEVKDYLKTRYDKQGNVFLGIPHRLDRPTSGLVVYARTTKALSRMTALFRDKQVRKTYWAALDKAPPEERGTLTHFLVRNPKKNKSYVCSEGTPNAKPAVLHYRLIGRTQRYFLVEIDLETGRHHQIRAQFAALGCRIKGDLKYGAARSNPDGGIHLHARSLHFVHPVSQRELTLSADPPDDPVWNALSEG